MINLELCKKFRFNHTNKWYTHNPEYILEDDTHKILRDFEIQIDYIISARSPDLVRTEKKNRTCRIVDSVVLSDHRVKLKVSKSSDKYQDLARDLKTQWNMMVAVISILIGALGTMPKGLLKGLENWEIKG